jgi:hypothetical protein
MHSIELEIEKLVGYSTVGSGEKQIKKLGSAKLGCKRKDRISSEPAVSANRVNAAA